MFPLSIQKYKKILLSPWSQRWCWRGHGRGHHPLKLFNVMGKALSGELSCAWTGLVIITVTCRTGSSIVSLTSSLRGRSLRGQLVKCFMTLEPTTLIFFVENMREAFALLTKNIGIFEKLTAKNLKKC